jgi:hypothetical protein
MTMSARQILLSGFCLVFFLPSVTVFSATSKAGVDSAVAWSEHARRFTGESSAVRQTAIDELRRDPHLMDKLRKALGSPEHFLALDVIATLELRSMLPLLIKFSEKDRTGYSYHVINSLMTPKEQPEIARIYTERLRHPKVSAASKMTLLDSLGRMNQVLEESLIGSLIRHETPEVRSATLYFLRNGILKRGHTSAIALLEPALRDEAFQLRLQTLHLLGEIPAQKRQAWFSPTLQAAIQGCVKDPFPQVRALCRSLAASLSSGGP